MSKKTKIQIAVFCVFCAVLSFLFYINNNRLTLNGLIAPININVEVDKTYITDILIVVEPYKQIISQLIPTASLNNNLRTTIIHTELKNVYAQGISIRVPSDMNHDIISSINNISVFIGNKLFYFHSSDISVWNYTVNENSLDYSIPVGIYEKSLIKPWINWYGDLNLFLMEIQALITQPYKFLLVYIFLFIFLLLFASEMQTKIIKYNRQIEIILLLMLITFAFLLRINGMTRYSAWSDELYSADISDPKYPIVRTFTDPGNPPFYFLLLRMWFTITGWSEMSGRLLSVLIGIGGILTLYFFIKSLCGKKYAFASAFLLTFSYTSLGYSNEMRAYILLIMLCPLISHVFMHLLKHQNFKNSCIYAICSMLLVNTHYYGVLYIAANFLFYFVFNQYTLKRLVIIFTTKQYVFERKKIIIFAIVNIVIALSLVPFFVITAFKRTLMNENFNSWIPNLGKKELIYGILVLLMYIGSRFLINRCKKFCKDKILLINYASLVVAFIYLIAFLISILYRNIFTWRYFSLCLPFIIALSISILFIDIKIIINVFIFEIKYYSNKFHIAAYFVLLTLFASFFSNLSLLGGGYSDVYKECCEYISKDSVNYSLTAELNATLTTINENIRKFYGQPSIPKEIISIEKDYDFIYVNPSHKNIQEMDKILIINNLSLNNVLKIRVREGKYIYKIKH